ncbi:MAG TPA: hypothetical protein PLF61_06310 [Candidatus Goldiibacteriota bacterium]|nr:hypothetical protein [Candidatus Goldiibacteriota bacterium]
MKGDKMGYVLVSLLATLIWFITGIIIYAYPPFKRASREAEKAPSVKKWGDPVRYLMAEFIYIFIQCFLFAWVFSVIKVSLPADLFMQAISFTLIIIAIKFIPEMFKMFIHTTYPSGLVFIDFIYNVFASFEISIIYVLLI